jgi:hypothetical protein
LLDHTFVLETPKSRLLILCDHTFSTHPLLSAKTYDGARLLAKGHDCCHYNASMFGIVGAWALDHKVYVLQTVVLFSQRTAYFLLLETICLWRRGGLFVRVQRVPSNVKW